MLIFNLSKYGNLFCWRSLANTVKNNLDNIFIFFNNRNSNANAEPFNSKIKLFRANQSDVVDKTFLLFILYKIFCLVF
jgi:transposase